MAERTLPLLPGTIDLLILRALRWEPTHGAGVTDWIRLVTGGVFALEEGTVYPALHRRATTTSPAKAGRGSRRWWTTGSDIATLSTQRCGTAMRRRRSGRRLNLQADWHDACLTETAYRCSNGAVDAAIRHGYPRGLRAEEGSPRVTGSDGPA